jgi:hypothetical protein
MSEPTPETPDTPNSPEQAALELYHQLVNLSPDNGDRALLISIRLPNAQLVGDVWLSAEDVEQLIDGTLTIAQHRMAYGDPEPAAAPLLRDEEDVDPWPRLSQNDITDDAVEDLAAEFQAFLKSEGGQA